MRPDWIKPGTRVLNQWRLGPALTGETVKLILSITIDASGISGTHPIALATILGDGCRPSGYSAASRAFRCRRTR